MRILLSNDDGYLAPGLRCLARVLSQLGEVQVVAPERDRSGASNSLTLTTPIRARTAENGFIFVDGTPTDCVHLAITGLLEKEPDVVVSGVNAGGNLGDDVIYSGTVAAAMEGRFLGLPAIAVSLVFAGAGHYETAARVALAVLRGMPGSSIPKDTVLNINVPDLPWSDLGGVEVTRLGHRHRAEPVVRSVDPRGEPIYWVGPPGEEQDAGPGTDFHAVRCGLVSITPLQVDLTRHTALADTAQWVRGISLS
jgi:5'-nucleotidase